MEKSKEREKGKVSRTDYMINKNPVGPGEYDPHVRYIPMFKMNTSAVFASKTEKGILNNSSISTYLNILKLNFRTDSKNFKALDTKFLIQPDQSTTLSTLGSNTSKLNFKKSNSKLSKKRLPILPPDPLKNFRGITMGPGEYEIKRDILPQKPKTNTVNLGVGFNSKSIRFDFMEPKKKIKTLKKISKEEEIMKSLIFSRDAVEMNSFENDNNNNYTLNSDGNFSRDERFKVKKAKIGLPGPGAYDIPGFADGDFHKESAFFRSNSKRLKDSEIKKIRN